jgi:oxygen-independent coproporphyrinogen-3 oxidase
VTNPSIDPKPEPATTRLDDILTDTEVGSVFVSNYPPYSFWSDEHLDAVSDVLDTQPGDAAEAVPDLGLYLHIPFCRKRCKFCYFRVFTDKNAAQIETYLAALVEEVEMYRQRSRIDGRALKFIYFGGGTPSYISARHLRSLVSRLQDVLPWDAAQEISFECEPGTLTEAKLVAIREVGVTRLSLGVENLDDSILRENGRAHVSEEVYRVMPWIQQQAFSQLNVDLIAGMVGETWETWRDTVQRTIDLDADSVTVYQMELPYNTVYSKALGGEAGAEIRHADWQTKREWHQYAFEQLQSQGYRIASAYTVVKGQEGDQRFVYRDALWRGSDMIGAGVSAISHMGGVHYQNQDRWDDYLAALARHELPVSRAFPTTADERLTRELILQLKLGQLVPSYFQQRYGVDIIDRFEGPLQALRSESMLSFDANEVRLTPDGMLRVDQLLPAFYDERYQNSRYT